jgi:hypothetical protein
MRAKSSRRLLATLGPTLGLLLLPALHTAAAREQASRSRGQEPWVGLHPSTGEAYARTTHVMRTRVGASLDGSRLELVKVVYAGERFDGCFEAMALRSVVRAGLDTDGDGRVDQDMLPTLTGLLKVEQDGTVFFTFDGSLRVREGDTLELAYADVVNPAAGSYRVEVEVNQQPSDAPRVATLEVWRSTRAPPACSGDAEEELAPRAARAAATLEL